MVGSIHSQVAPVRKAPSGVPTTDLKQVDLPFEEPQDAYRAQLVEGTNERQEPYVIVPGTSGEMMSRSGLIERLRKLNIFVNGEIPLIKGFTAVLNEEMKKRVEKAGFETLQDRDGKFLHPNPWERGQDQAPEIVEQSPFGPRKELEQPRNLTPLTQQFTGKGVGIAIIDTGVYPHFDMTSPSNRIVGFKDFVDDRTLPSDANGHGTHVAGVAAGNGYLSNGLYRGAAPDANIVGVRVLDANGNGSPSNILKGINWAVENKARYNIRVINLSLGANLPPGAGKSDPIVKAVEKATEEGIVVVVSAGNNGPRPGTVLSPGDSPKVITVGAVDDRNTPDPSDDRVTDFSGRGSKGSGKPDLVAPGEAIIGPNAPGSYYETAAKKYSSVNNTLGWLNSRSDEELVQVPEDTLFLMGLNPESVRRFKASPTLARYELNRLIEATERMPIVQGNYIGIPGTSTAAPYVAGVVADMLEANPDLTPEQVKEMLKQSATPLPGFAPESQGAGMVNPDRAIALALKAQEDQTEEGQLRLFSPSTLR